ncbi:EamA family transporter [uncultured Microbacterium sp.]|uniref:DMT family transporter n=1 Tax=uncultured Microbacterium sp. TaxID=191216 RepID=UPI0025D025FF|nr:EamA family transporter [uncultured Microbacterium sp.]
MFRMWPVFAVVGAALCFATTGTAQALAGVDASPLAVGAARILLGGALLAIVAGSTAARSRWADGPGISSPGTPTPGIPIPVASPAFAPRRPSWPLVVVGAAGVLAYQPLFFLGTRENGVAIGTVVALGSAPVITGALDALLRRRAPTRTWVIATTIALVGVVLVSGVVGDNATSLTPAGLLASVGAGASYAAYTLASKALLDRGWSPTATMGALFGWAAFASIPLLAYAGAGWLLTPRGLALVLWLGVVTTAVAYVLFAWGLARLRATTVSTLTLAEPLGATLLGLLVLHEHIGPVAAIGLAVIAVGLVVIALPQRTSARATP